MNQLKRKVNKKNPIIHSKLSPTSTNRTIPPQLGGLKMGANCLPNTRLKSVGSHLGFTNFVAAFQENKVLPNYINFFPNPRVFQLCTMLSEKRLCAAFEWWILLNNVVKLPLQTRFRQISTSSVDFHVPTHFRMSHWQEELLSVLSYSRAVNVYTMQCQTRHFLISWGGGFWVVYATIGNKVTPVYGQVYRN